MYKNWLSSRADRPARPPRLAPRTPTDSELRCQCIETQNCFFNTDTGKALTTVRAGLALTICIFPKISFLPAFVAGLRRVLIMHKPGSVNLPTLLTCFVAISANFSTIFVHSFLLISVASESAWARPPLLISLAPAFMAFMGAMPQPRKQDWDERARSWKHSSQGGLAQALSDATEIK